MLALSTNALITVNGRLHHSGQACGRPAMRILGRKPASSSRTGQARTGTLLLLAILMVVPNVMGRPEMECKAGRHAILSSQAPLSGWIVGNGMTPRHGQDKDVIERKRLQIKCKHTRRSCGGQTS